MCPTHRLQLGGCCPALLCAAATWLWAAAALHYKCGNAPGALTPPQALLEARGTVTRLGLLQAALRKHRKVLAALASLKGLDE
jgi:hypothetical protein